MSERKHVDLWKKLADEVAEDEIDRAANMSVEQAESELRAAGFDVATERAKASAFLDALESGKPIGTVPISPAAKSTTTAPSTDAASARSAPTSIATPTTSTTRPISSPPSTSPPTSTSAIPPTSTPAPTSTATGTLTSLEMPEKPKPKDARRTQRRPALAWLAAAATFGAAVGGTAVSVFQPTPTGGGTTSTPSADDLAAATNLRRLAAAACDASQWDVCLANLDKARALDSIGDSAPPVRNLRTRAIAGILK
jgi:hypothetical protein